MYLFNRSIVHMDHKIPSSNILRADRRPWSAAISSKFLLHPWIGLQLSLECQISLVKCPISRKHHHHALAGSLLYVLLMHQGICQNRTLANLMLPPIMEGKIALGFNIEIHHNAADSVSS